MNRFKFRVWIAGYLTVACAGVAAWWFGCNGSKKRLTVCESPGSVGRECSVS
jgi:hypothetical protein